jgi:FkbM family methyltransferase
VRRFGGGRRIGPIFDVGANIGQTASVLSRYFPDDELFCFEPVDASFRQLEARFGKRATCIKAALGAEPGHAQITLHENSELNTLVAGGRTGLATGVEEIQILTLDGFCAERGVEVIGLLKMDVQGWELAVLDGARAMLDRRAIRMVLCEVGFGGADQTDMLPFGAVQERMLAEGFVFGGLYEQFRHGPRKQFVDFANAIYVLPA